MFSGVFAKRRESYGAQDCLCREVNPYVIRPWNARRGMISEMSGVREDISGGYCGGVPPLPIPNREVKPTSADGTAMQCGRVGNRLLFFERSHATGVARLLFSYWQESGIWLAENE